MDEDLQNLEDELTRLRPAGPSGGLWRRLESELAPRRRGFAPWVWLALPAAAAIAMVAAVDLRRDETLPGVQSPAPVLAAAGAAPAFKPVSADNLMVDARDEGYVTLDDGTPARRVSRSYVDTITWEDPGTHASLRWSVPSQEVRVVPVSYQ